MDTVEEFIKNTDWKIDYIVAVPSSLQRNTQPVIEVAKEISRRLSIPTCEKAVVKVKATPPMKNIESLAERAETLNDAFRCESEEIRGRPVLLIDDLFEYGSTVRAVSTVLIAEGQVAAVYLLALTRRRT